MRQIKMLLGVLAFRSGFYRLLFRNKAVIVLFHRVDDRYASDPISCTRGKFSLFCAFFSKYFIVVPLSELLRKLKGGEPIGRHLVITFDDGYRDNYEFAAKELTRMKLPGCFFIATDFIDSNRVPWWDADAGIVSEWMSWSQVRGLSAQGFELGAHTCNHVDLGIVIGAEAEKEIVESGRRLSMEIARPVPFFSYPYGRRHQITPPNRALVQRAGYACCRV